ncbi:MAG: TetR/AcrR family transcriptional regulator [Pseudomonadota bacterium]
MSPRQSNTREKIVERARSLLQHHGLDGFSYRDISTHLGIRNAAVHYHFPSKDDLGLALVEDFASEIERDIEHAQRAGMPPKDQLEVYFQRSHGDASGDHRICMFGALATSYSRLSDAMQRAMVRLRSGVHRWLADTLEAGRRSGTLRFVGDPEAKAAVIATAIQGARQVNRMSPDDIVAVVIDQLREELYVPTSKE